MNTKIPLAWLVLVLGIVVNQYGFLHDVIFKAQDGLIAMGLKSYVVVVLGILMTLVGALMLRQAKN